MNYISAVGSRSALFNNAAIRLRSYPALRKTSNIAAQFNRPSAHSLLQIHQLREALSALRPGKLRSSSFTIAAQAASAISMSSINFGTNSPTQIRSTEEINTAPTSFQHDGPAWIGSTLTAPWSGLGSTADAIVGGSYDGSNGQGTLTFEVNRAGTHGEDDLRIKVFADGGEFIENINIGQNDPLNQVYQLSNGLEVTLGAGDLVMNDFFEVDVSVLSTSYTPNEPGFMGSTANPAIGGLYDGSNGSGDLTFRVTRDGVHGQDDLQLKVYAPDDTFIEKIDIKKNDAIDKIYTLSNGLTFSLGEGELIKNETFNVAVDANDPDSYPSAPEWIFSSATPTLTGTYDGSNGTGTLTFKVLDNGVHGEDDLRVRVFKPDGSTLETIDIDKDDPVDATYELSNGLAVTFSAGNLIKNETFTVDVEAAGIFTTQPNPVTSTAEPALSGIYDGSLGTDVLEFTVTGGGIHGLNDLSFDIRTSDGTLLESISIAASDDPEQQYELSNGLVFSLGAGALTPNESFTLSVNHLVPTSVDPNLSFDGTGVNDAMLEDQYTITDGSFQINGNTIEVFANDSINSVLDRINDAGIDVTASFDASSETIVIAHDLIGSEYDVELSNDTSGFLAATKLDGAIATSAGGDETTVLSDLNITSEVSSGTLMINNSSIAIDVDVDSLEDVLLRIESSVPEVDVDFNSETGLVSITATAMTSLEISSGGTGFFAAIGIDEGSYQPIEARNIKSREKGLSYQARRETARAINKFAKRFNAVFEERYFNENNAYFNKIRDELKAVISETFSPDNSRSPAAAGIDIDFDANKHSPIQTSESFKKDIENSLKTAEGTNAFNDLFFANGQDEGIVERMLDIVKAAEQDLSLQLSGAGTFVNFRA